MKASEIGIEEGLGQDRRGRGAPTEWSVFKTKHFDKGVANLGTTGVGDTFGLSPDLGETLSDANRLGAGSPVSVSVASATAFESPASADVVGEACSAFFSLNLASRPSTRFRSASRTSVLGPRFLGTASVKRRAWSATGFIE